MQQRPWEPACPRNANSAGGSDCCRAPLLGSSPPKTETSSETRGPPFLDSRPRVGDKWCLFMEPSRKCTCEFPLPAGSSSLVTNGRCDSGVEERSPHVICCGWAARGRAWPKQGHTSSRRSQAGTGGHRPAHWHSNPRGGRRGGGEVAHLKCVGEASRGDQLCTLSVAWEMSAPPSALIHRSQSASLVRPHTATRWVALACGSLPLLPPLSKGGD